MVLVAAMLSVVGCRVGWWSSKLVCSVIYEHIFTLAGAQEPSFLSDSISALGSGSNPDLAPYSLAGTARLREYRSTGHWTYRVPNGLTTAY